MEIVQFAEANQVDLIVISTRGRSGVSRWLMGSAADRVVRGAGEIFRLGFRLVQVRISKFEFRNRSSAPPLLASEQSGFCAHCSIV